MQFREKKTATDILYYYKPTKFWLWFWVTVDFIMFIYPIFWGMETKLQLLFDLSIGFFFLFISIIQFVFYYEICIKKAGISFIFLYGTDEYNWNELKKIKTYRGRNNKYIYFSVETQKGKVYKFYLPRQDSEKIYEILRKYSNN